MTPKELRAVEAGVATIVGLLVSLDLAGAVELMDAVQKHGRAVDPLAWARAKDAHLRMRALMEAALVFQNTVANVRGEIPKPNRRSPIILPS